MRTVSLYSPFSIFFFFFFLHIPWWPQEAFHIKLLISSTVLGPSEGGAKMRRVRELLQFTQKTLYISFFVFHQVSALKNAHIQQSSWTVYVPILTDYQTTSIKVN